MMKHTRCQLLIAAWLMMAISVRGRKRCRSSGEDPEVPLTVEPVSQIRTLVGSCKTDIGACPIGMCRYDPQLNKKCPADGIWCTGTETRPVDCGILGTFNVTFVTSCTCCRDSGIQINGVVVDSDERLPLSKVLLRINKKTKAKSDSAGKFKTVVSSGTTRISISAKLRKGNYFDTIKVVEVPHGFKGPINVVVIMMKMSEPIKIDSSEDNSIPLTSDPNGEKPRAVIGIRANSFQTKKDQYTGTVFMAMGFIDTSDRNVEEEIPGQFLTGRGRNLQPLISDGMFALSFQGENGEKLKVTNAVVRVQTGMKLWALSADGIWTPISETETRKKRQVELTDEFLIDIESAQWVNIDKIPGAPTCYFKGRIFEETTDDEIISSATATFKPEVVAYTTLDQRLRLYQGATNMPSSVCYEVRCPDIANPDDTLVGLITMKSYESISIGGIMFPFTKVLRPRDLVEYSAALLPRLGNVQYEVTPSEENVFVNFISDPLGPFYPSLADCEASEVEDASIHFLKPELPSYIPYPADIDICTARVGFFDGGNFESTLEMLDDPVSLTALSTWEVDGTGYYYTHTDVISCSDIGDDFMYVCIKYRCSTEDAITTIRIDIDIPLIEANFSDTKLPAFTCQGDCITGDCSKGDRDDGSGVTIDGSFEAPVEVGDGPDFFMDFPNDCDDRSASEAFAAEYTCYGYRSVN